MWSSEPRIVPGDPSHSLLVQLVTSRGTKNPAADQMPPIATSIVDAPDTQSVITWIGAMPLLSTSDGGTSDGGTSDGGTGDGGTTDGGTTDGGS
jgi:hypothetical protein